jgi:glycosyltransferase involved in cell wall biosynthesis
VSGKGRRLRIGLNLLHALREIGGGWNYISSLVAALAVEGTENDYVAFVSEESRNLVPALSNWTEVLCAVDVQSRARRVWFEMTELQGLTRAHRVDCMHWFDYTQAPWNAAPAIVSLWDLQPFLHLSEESAAKRLFLRGMLRWMSRRRSLLLPMSQTTADGFREVLGIAQSRMTVLPPVLGRLFRPPGVKDVEEFRSRYALPEKFWVYVAHGYPHKNHVRLLETYGRLRSGDPRGWPLVLRGDGLEKNEAIMKALDDARRRGEIRLLPRLATEELPLLYGAATAQVFPSLYEGGGIPVVEALACGCAVAAADLPVVREFAGDSVLLFDPEDTGSIGATMSRIENGDVDLEALRVKGFRAAERFRAEKVVPVALAAYRRAVGGVGA